MKGVRICGGKDLMKKYLLSLEWKKVGVTDGNSGNDVWDKKS